MQGEGECTEPEKTRQYTDEEGNVKELYVPKEDIVDKELNKSGINFAKYVMACAQSGSGKTYKGSQKDVSNEWCYRYPSP